MSPSVQETVRRGYDDHYRDMTEKTSGLCEIPEIREKLISLTYEASSRAYNQRQSGSLTSKDILLSSFYLVTQLGLENFEIDEQPSFHIKVACFLLSKQGMFYLSGLQLRQNTDDEHTWQTIALEKYFEKVLKGEYTNMTFPDVVEAITLLQDRMVAKRIKGVVESISAISQSSSVFKRILRMDFQQKDSSVFKMEYPHGDVTNLWFRLLTYLMFPSAAGFSWRQLFNFAHREFVYTCKRDEIKCIICDQKSDQLEGNCDVTSFGFHRNDCCNVREGRLSFRLKTLHGFPASFDRKLVDMANRGLFSSGDDLKVTCCRCLKKTDAREFSSYNFAAFHFPDCTFTP
uniref:Baculoviral IAP repeat-containing protein 7 n=1 Tax=Phallusia mammillata TaxID=59560 RepID=A0A6F9D7F9_9ASCI|nr:baculoviral IAP repeat-containing protein 7 [Phallusia mammillata]